MKFNVIFMCQPFSHYCLWTNSKANLCTGYLVTKIVCYNFSYFIIFLSSDIAAQMYAAFVSES